MQAITHPEHAESHATHLREGYFMGCLPAVVTSVNDPNKAGRIRAMASLIDDLNDLPNATDGWIPVTTSYVLTDTPGGKVSPLQVGSQVILIPILGQMDNWICIGAIHTSAEPPHASHDLYEGSYGERTPEGITHVRSGNAAEVKTYPHGVIKGITATGDVITKTTETTVTQSVDGRVLMENKNSSMNLSPTGTIGIINATGNRIDLSDTGSISVTSASKSSMVFVDGKVEIAGPPSGNNKIAEYQKTLSKGIGGLNEMFSGLGNIDLKTLGVENIAATIGTVNEAIAKGRAVVADYEVAKTQASQILDDLIKNPAAAIKIISPQVSQFLDNNLDKVLPIVRQAATGNIGGTEILKQISGFLPAGITTTAQEIDRTLGQFRTTPDLAAAATVDRIYGTQAGDYESLIGSNLQYSVGRVVEVFDAVAPTYSEAKTEAIALLTSTGALATTLSNTNAAILATYTQSEVEVKIDELAVNDPAYLDEAIAAAWRKYRIGEINNSLPADVIVSITEATIDKILNAPDAVTAIATLLGADRVARIESVVAVDPLLDTGIAQVELSSEVMNALDLGNRDESLARLVELGQNSGFSAVGVLLDRVAAIDLTKPLIRNPIGDFKLEIEAVRNRLNLQFETEDPLCQAVIRFIFADLDRYKDNRVRVFASQAIENPNWTIDTGALIFQTDALIEGTKKYQVSYRGIDLFWEDLRLTIEQFISSQVEIDKQIADYAIAAQLKSKIKSEADDYSSDRLSRKIIPSDWTAPESFDLRSLEGLESDILQLRANLGGIPVLTDGCDNSDAVVLTIADLTIQQILDNIEKAKAEKRSLLFSTVRSGYDRAEGETAKYQLASIVRSDLLDLYLNTLDNLFVAERDRAKNRHLETIAKQTATQRRDGRPMEGNTIPYAVTLMEYRTMAQRVLANLEDTNKDLAYAIVVSRILSEFNIVINDWFRRNSTANSATELIDLPSLYDLKSTVTSFIDRVGVVYNSTFPQINLLWDELSLTTDYLLFYPTSQPATGNNQIFRTTVVNLPGSYAKPTDVNSLKVSEADWLQATIGIAKSIVQDITNLYPPFKEYQEIAVKALDALPTIFPSAKMTLTPTNIDIKASNTGAQVSLGESTARLASGAGAAVVNLGAGIADITTGSSGAALSLAAGLGKLTGGPLGGSVLATMGAATLTGPGGFSSIGAGIGGLNFSTPWGGFGFGSRGFGLTGDRPVSFAVQEADNNGGTSALYLDTRKGVGIHSTEEYTGEINAEINVFNGVVSISCSNNPLARIRLDANGVTIGNVNMSYFSEQFGYIFNRLHALESTGGS